MYTGFKVTIQILIRIEFRRIGWKEQKLNFTLVLFQPFLNQGGVTQRKPGKVSDKEAMRWIENSYA